MCQAEGKCRVCPDTYEFLLQTVLLLSACTDIIAFCLAGLAAFIAQAKYDSIVLEIITLSSAVVLLVRVVLGYKRMYNRSAALSAPLGMALESFP